MIGLTLAAVTMALTVQFAEGPTFVVHAQGYEERIVAQEWAVDFEEFGSRGPHTDRVGNIYAIAPSTDHDPSRIMKLASGGPILFAEVRGPGEPYLVDMGFDVRNDMVVVVHSTHRLPAGGYGIWRSYHKISGFPVASAGVGVLQGDGLLDRLSAHVPRYAILICLAFTVCIAGAAIGRQLVHDVRGLIER